ncbi:hypothetical protein GH793_15845, partial [Listeria monocytogenes]|nr:hypothetical protein [Listeria monocytogenes]
GNRKRTRIDRRSWKPFSAVLQGMVLQLDEVQTKYKKYFKKEKITIRLHHALAYPQMHKNMSNVLCLKTADSRVFYIKAESEEEQKIWVETINLIAARYSAPPLISTSNSIEEHPQVLPSFPS